MTTTATAQTVTMEDQIIKKIAQAGDRQMTARRDLAESIREGSGRSESIMSQVQTFASHKVHADLWSTVNSLAEFAMEEHQVDRYARAVQLVVDQNVRDILSQGADDGWSGHGNDLRRVEFEAKRRWTTDARDMIEFGS